MTGIVIKGFGKYYTVLGENGVKTNCALRGKMRKDPALKKYSDPVAVGDNVEFLINDDEYGIIENVNDRNNVFSRKDRSSPKEDIIASNLDQIVVIQSFINPKFNPRFVDRLLVRGTKENIPVFLCLNKSDLKDDKDLDYLKEYYKGTGLTIVVSSVKTGDGIEDLKKIVYGKRSIFSGYSGVGKSSLLNRLFPDLTLRISDVSELTGKGRHTTTNVELVNFPDGTGVIDTPGVREFGLVDIASVDLSNYFHEFSDNRGECRFKECTHDHEPGCVVKEMVEKGEINRDRHTSYLNILYSLKEYEDSRYR